MQAVNWRLIIEKHGPAVWQTAYRLLGNHADAADCFQETFICALEVSRRQRVRSFPALLVWLATVRAIDRLRRRFSQSKSKANLDLAAVPANNPGPAQQAQTRELAVRLRKALTQLPQRQAQAFCLRYFNDFSYRRIAKELGIKTGAAGVLLHRAREKLQAVLESSTGEEQK